MRSGVYMHCHVFFQNSWTVSCAWNGEKILAKNRKQDVDASSFQNNTSCFIVYCLRLLLEMISLRLEAHTCFNKIYFSTNTKTFTKQSTGILCQDKLKGLILMQMKWKLQKSLVGSRQPISSHVAKWEIKELQGTCYSFPLQFLYSLLLLCYQLGFHLLLARLFPVICLNNTVDLVKLLQRSYVILQSMAFTFLNLKMKYLSRYLHYHFFYYLFSRSFPGKREALEWFTVWKDGWSICF